MSVNKNLNYSVTTLSTVCLTDSPVVRFVHQTSYELFSLNLQDKFGGFGEEIGNKQPGERERERRGILKECDDFIS